MAAPNTTTVSENTTTQSLAASNATTPKRLLSLDAYRGLVMILLAAHGFGIAHMASLPEDAAIWRSLDYDAWSKIAFHFSHSKWVTNFGWIGVPVWDMIQPCFMFMVGVAMPFSYARRQSSGHSPNRRLCHAILRGLLLVLIGVFLRSVNFESTHWVFIDVLSQIGLGYVFLYLLMDKSRTVQGGVFVAILVGYWFFFFLGEPTVSTSEPSSVTASQDEGEVQTSFEGFFSPWSKNRNAAYQADVWLLNQFPRPEGEVVVSHHRHGYVTFNFIPSIATMLLGVFCGQLLRSERKPGGKFGILIIAGSAFIVLGVVSGMFLCPIIKVIWTPSWVLFSGGWAILLLAAFFLVFDILRLSWLAFPLVVVGMNSIAMYVMGYLMRPWTIKNVKIHFGSTIEWLLGSGIWADDMYGRVAGPTAAFIVFWLIAIAMYRSKIFFRV